jgi:hypothetical protein
VKRDPESGRSTGFLLEFTPMEIRAGMMETARKTNTEWFLVLISIDFG